MPSAVITGASRGIGAQIAQELAQDHDLILCATKLENLNNIFDIIKNNHPNCNITKVAFDAKNPELIATSLNPVLSQLDKIDVLINNAGIVLRGGVDGTSSDFTEMLNVNLVSLFNITKLVLPYMRQQQSGYIFNISSMAGIRPVPTANMYSTSKYAVTGFSLNLGRELIPDNIKVTAICPSVIDTDMTKNFDMSNDDKIKTTDISKTVRYCLSLSKNTLIDTINIQCPSLV